MGEKGSRERGGAGASQVIWDADQLPGNHHMASAERPSGPVRRRSLDADPLKRKASTGN